MTVNNSIITNRLLIRPFELEHISEEYLSWMNNKKLLSFSEQRHKNHTFDTAKKYLDSFKNTENMFWAIEETACEIGHIGNINAYIDRNNLTADLGILIGNVDVQNKGYATEAWKAVCKYLFLKKDIRKITAGALSINFPMLKLMKKAGMKEDGKRLRHYIVNGKYVDLQYMAIFK